MLNLGLQIGLGVKAEVGFAPVCDLQEAIFAPFGADELDATGEAVG